MTENELQQIQLIGEGYCQTLGNMVDGMDSPEAQMHFVRLTFDAVITQLVRRQGFANTSAFLRRAADHVDSENRRSMQ